MIRTDYNLLPEGVRPFGTAMCQWDRDFGCTSVGEDRQGNTVLANDERQRFTIPGSEAATVADLITGPGVAPDRSLRTRVTIAENGDITLQDVGGNQPDFIIPTDEVGGTAQLMRERDLVGAVG